MQNFRWHPDLIESFLYKAKRRTIKLIYRFIHFGFLVTFFDYLYEITRINIINEKKHKIIVSWILNKYHCFISDFTKNNNLNLQQQNKIPKYIWICWWDGMDMMPPLVKACYNSVLTYAKDFNVILITKDNYNDYTSIPVHILEKIDTKKLTLTHFSDILRTALLYTHGGLWLDATFLVTEPVNLGDHFFFTIRKDNYGLRHIAKGRWQGNCIAGVPNFFYFKFVFDLLCEYWKEYDYLLTYHIYDYFINLAYDSFPEVKSAFDSINKTNKNDIIVNNLNNKFDQNIFNEAIDNTVFHKLNWKKKCSIKTYDDILTFYGYILNTYL